MPMCFTCGNEYGRTFSVTTHAGTKYDFDCLECAIQELAPACTHCGCRIIGHGIERHHDIYCCENCARHDMPLQEEGAIHPEDELIDEASDESFPASDPPGWIGRQARSLIDQKP